MKAGRVDAITDSVTKRLGSDVSLLKLAGGRRAAGPSNTLSSQLQGGSTSCTDETRASAVTRSLKLN